MARKCFTCDIIGFDDFVICPECDRETMPMNDYVMNFLLFLRPVIRVKGGSAESDDNFYAQVVFFGANERIEFRGENDGERSDKPMLDRLHAFVDNISKKYPTVEVEAIREINGKCFFRVTTNDALSDKEGKKEEFGSFLLDIAERISM